MSMGVIFWIILLVLLSMMMLRLAKSSHPSHKKLDPKVKKGRSLSEVPSEAYSNRLNKRFDQADAFEDEQRSRTSEESLIKRSEALPKRPLSNTKDSGSEWVYANPALVMNEMVPHSSSVMTRQHSDSPEKVYSIPRTFTTMRSISREESETSESRKIGLLILHSFRRRPRRPARPSGARLQGSNYQFDISNYYHLKEQVFKLAFSIVILNGAAYIYWNEVE